MVTLVGTQADALDAFKELLELEDAAIEAYEAAINRLDNASYKTKMKEFRSDHERHREEITALLKENEVDLPTMPSPKEWLAQGKVVLANLMGDDAILRAMKSNEIDTNTAYERMNERDDLTPDMQKIAERGLADERRHKRWIDETLEAAD